MANEWTIETLKEHFEKILVEKDKAINIALANADKWMSAANEWRAAMNDREKNFITRREVWLVVVAMIGIALGVIKFV